MAGPEDFFLEEGMGIEAPAGRRRNPVPPRSGLGGILEDFSRLRSASDPGLLERTVGEITAQWPYYQSHGVARQSLSSQVSPFIDVQVRRDLSHLDSRILPVISGDPKATAEMNRMIDGFLRSDRPVITAEYKDVARRMKGMLPQLKYVMQLGVGPARMGLPMINFRESILQALCLEAFTTVPNAAGMTTAKMDRLLTQQAAKLGVIGRKGAKGRLLGAPGPMVAEYLPIIQEIVAPGIGLRAGRGPERFLLRPDVLSTESLTLGEPQAQARRNIRELEAERSGISTWLARKDTEIRARHIMRMFRENLSMGDQTRIMDMIGENSRTIGQSFRNDPERTAVRLLAALKSSDRDLADLELPYQDRIRLADQIEESVTMPRKAHGAVKTSMTKAVEEAGYVSEQTAMKELKKMAKSVSKVTGRPPPTNLPFVLALASVIGAGMLAAGFSREEAA